MTLVTDASCAPSCGEEVSECVAPAARPPGMNLFLDDNGAGHEPVLFLHAACGSAAHWKAQLAHLRAGGHRAIAVDLPGHARSPDCRDVSPAGLAGELTTFVDALELQRFALVAHSYGSFAAIALAAALKDRVSGIFFVDPPVDGTRGFTRKQADQQLTGVRKDPVGATKQFYEPMLASSTEATRSLVLGDLAKTRPRVIVDTVESSFDYDAAKPLGALAMPRFALVTPRNEGPASLHVLVPDVSHQRIDDTGHWVHLDAPDQVNALLGEFLGRLR